MYADLLVALEGAATKLGRQVNPTVYSRAELARRMAEENAFVRRVLAQPKLWLTGDEHALAP